MEASSRQRKDRQIVGSCVNVTCKCSKNLEAVAPVHVPSLQIYRFLSLSVCTGDSLVYPIKNFSTMLPQSNFQVNLLLGSWYASILVVVLLSQSPKGLGDQKAVLMTP